MIYGSDLGSIRYIHKLRKKFGREFQEYISASLLIVCFVQINSSTAFFLLVKPNMVNDTSITENDDFVCFNPVDCGVHIVLHIHCKSLDKVVIFLLWVIDAFTLTIGGTKRAPIGHMDPYRKLL
jgi:hypothetical protein